MHRAALPFLVAAALAAAAPEAGAQAAAAMVRVPAGTYLPLHASRGDRQAVGAFSLDRDPVTRGDYEAFLRRRPRWRITSSASAGAPTPHDLDSLARHRPATGMTWHAARAYCAARGARLPTLAEWEYVAAASATRRDAARDPAFMQRLLTTYSTRPRPLPPVHRGAINAYGVRGMHDLVWEWVADAGQAHDHARRESHGAHEPHDAWCASAAIGAADPRNYPAFLRLAVRSRLTPDASLETLGFRCATS